MEKKRNEQDSARSASRRRWEEEHQERRKESRQRYEEKWRREHGGRNRDRSRWGTRAIPLRYFCEICKRGKKATVRHHIIPRSERGSNEASNLIEVCRNHHNSLEALCYDFKRKILDVSPIGRRSYVLNVYRRNRQRYPTRDEMRSQIWKTIQKDYVQYQKSKEPSRKHQRWRASKRHITKPI